MIQQQFVFRRVNGRIVKMRLGHAAAAAGARAATRKISSRGGSGSITPHRGLQAASLAAAVGSGVFGAATMFSGGAKGFLASTAGSLGIDLASSALNIAAHAGKGRTKARAKAAAKQELVNTVVGNGVFLAGLLAQKQGREYLATGISKGLEVVNKYGSKLRALL